MRSCKSACALWPRALWRDRSSRVRSWSWPKDFTYDFLTRLLMSLLKKVAVGKTAVTRFWKSCLSAPLGIFQFLQDFFARFCSLIFFEDSERCDLRDRKLERRLSEIFKSERKRAYVLPLATTLCRRRLKSIYPQNWVRKDAKASLMPLRLVSKKFRYSRQSRVAISHHGVTRSESGALLYGHSEWGITETF